MGENFAKGFANQFGAKKNVGRSLMGWEEALRDHNRVATGSHKWGQEDAIRGHNGVAIKEAINLVGKDHNSLKRIGT